MYIQFGDVRKIQDSKVSNAKARKLVLLCFLPEDDN